MAKPLTDRETRALLDAARKCRENAHAPYSGFRVGAAVLAADGRVFPGCNVENASYGATVCAERVALYGAVSAGAREIRALALLTELPEPVPPCGVCRQVIAELAPDAVLLMANLAGETRIGRIRDLLPEAFRLPPVET